jgi:hypothetical protein
LALAAERVGDDAASIVRDAIAYAQSREVVGVIMRRVAESESDRVDPETAGTLRSLTGRSWDVSERERWLSWWEVAEFLPEGAWRREIAGAFAARDARQTAEAERRLARLRDVYSRLHRATPAGERQALLVELITDPTTPLALLGFELGERELLNARGLGAEIADAARSRLRSETPVLREGAASLLRSMGDAASASIAVGALAEERDPSARLALLRLAALDPTERGAAIAAGLLDGTPVMSRAAADYLAAAAAKNALVDGALRERVAQAALSTRPELIGPAHVALLDALRQPAATARIRALLEAEDPQVRLAAGRALASREEEIDRVIHAAEQQPDLAPVAVDAIVQHRPTADGLILAKRLAGVAEGDASDDLTRRVARRADFNALGAILNVSTPSERRVCLDVVVERAASLNRDEITPVVAGLVLDAAAIRIDDARPEEAIAAIEALPEEVSLDEATARRRWALLIESRARLSSLEGAGVRGPIDAWLDALESVLRAGAEEAARRVALAIEQELAERLSDDQADRFETLRARLGDVIGGADGAPRDQDREEETPGVSTIL